jgi:hypothetical protein
MSGDIHPLPDTPSCRGAQLKHRDNFTFTLYVTRRFTRWHRPKEIIPYKLPLNDVVPLFNLRGKDRERQRDDQSLHGR